MQGAGLVNAQAVDVLVADGDLGPVGARGDMELVLQVVRPAPGAQVDAIVEPLVGLAGDVRAVAGGIAHEEVEHRLGLLPPDRRDGVGSVEAGREPQGLQFGGTRAALAARHVVAVLARIAVLRLLPEEFEDQAAIRMRDTRPPPVEDEPDRLVGPLTLIGYEQGRGDIEQLDCLLLRKPIQQYSRLQRLEGRDPRPARGS